MNPDFDLPQGTIAPASEVSLALLARPHPFEPRNADAIERNWRAERARNPALFDGRTMLFSRLSLAGLPREPGYHVLDLPRGAAIVTRVILPFTAAEVEEGIRRFVASEADPEIARPVILRDGVLDGVRVAAHVPRLVAWHHASPPESARLVAFE